MNNSDFDEAWGRIDIWHRALPFSDNNGAEDEKVESPFQVVLCIAPRPREDYGHAHRN